MGNCFVKVFIDSSSFEEASVPKADATINRFIIIFVYKSIEKQDV